ncbi:hypothetical protein BAUCODRAFT_315191 [Baudoinia panamericana UAMH 10762]|uniref:Uncharacterized protein n=1 Tax=Baudoinia panamericana (strain UAMH 10762) TaxID=717646 RepID=M2LBB1_BAUPA|nr:uncharacterized protein BAUCODRAFT_315191 [Baudoinia panamericana UAMH 10762]EMC91112.1 hypothetical protein BAUCODRAFT_315191 [Baudoinia panamericana UAMH 10762]
MCYGSHRSRVRTEMWSAETLARRVWTSLDRHADRHRAAERKLVVRDFAGIKLRTMGPRNSVFSAVNLVTLSWECYRQTSWMSSRAVGGFVRLLRHCLCRWVPFHTCECETYSSYLPQGWACLVARHLPDRMAASSVSRSWCCSLFSHFRDSRSCPAFENHVPGDN